MSLRITANIEEPTAGLCNGSITVQASCGTPPYSYHWSLSSPGCGCTSTTTLSEQCSNSICDLSCGTYTLHVKDSCDEELTIQYILQPCPVQVGEKIVGPSGFGISTSLSDNGCILAIGGNNQVSVYRRIEGVWILSEVIPQIGGGIFGRSVSLSADGNTLAVGTNNNISFVYRYINSTWILQQTIQEPDGITQGLSVSLSGNAQYLAIGDPNFFPIPTLTRVYKFQGSWILVAKLFEPDIERQGISVSLNYQGDVLAVGSNPFGGDAYVQLYRRFGTLWQLNQTLIEPYNSPTVVSLDGSGKTLAIGIPDGNALVGLNVIYENKYGEFVSTAQLIGTGFNASTRQGFSVSLSRNGKVLASGGPDDSGNVGATWVWTRSDVWTQLCNKLVGSDSVGSQRQGSSVSVNANGTVLSVGGPSTILEGGVWNFALC